MLGLFLTPGCPAEDAILDALVDRGGRAGAERLRAALCPVPNGGPAAAGETEPELPAAGKGLYRAVLLTEPNGLAGRVTEFAGYLAAADDDTYRLCANLLLQQVYGEPAARAVTDDLYFVGVRLVWVQMSNLSRQLGLFEAVAGACVPEVRVGQPPPAARSPHRFAWLLARLADPAGTQRVRIGKG